MRKQSRKADSRLAENELPRLPYSLRFGTVFNKT